MTGLPARLAAAGLVVLGVLTLVLTGSALTRHGHAVSSGLPVDAASAAPELPAPSPSPSATTAPDPPASLALAFAGTALLRAEGVGSCSAHPRLTWDARPAQLPPGHLLRLRGDGARRALVVLGTGPRCATVRMLVTDDAGATWQPPDEPQRTWYLAAGVARSPTGDGPAACPVVDELAVVSRPVAVVRCGSSLFRTRDAGRTWVALPSPGGVPAAIAGSGRTVDVAVTGADGCAGVAVLRLVGATWTRLGCAPGLAAPDRVALAVAGRRLAVDAGGELVSTDGGSTWSPPERS